MAPGEVGQEVSQYGGLRVIIAKVSGIASTQIACKEALTNEDKELEEPVMGYAGDQVG